MTQTGERLKAELAALPSADRAELAQFLIHSLDDVVDADAEAAWDRELAVRAEEIESGAEVGEPAEKVLDELRGKCC
jgi:hypothetical protein